MSNFEQFDFNLNDMPDNFDFDKEFLKEFNLGDRFQDADSLLAYMKKELKENKSRMTDEQIKLATAQEKHLEDLIKQYSDKQDKISDGSSKEFNLTGKDEDVDDIVNYVETESEKYKEKMPADQMKRFKTILKIANKIGKSKHVDLKIKPQLAFAPDKDGKPGMDIFNILKRKNEQVDAYKDFNVKKESHTLLDTVRHMDYDEILVDPSLIDKSNLETDATNNSRIVQNILLGIDLPATYAMNSEHLETVFLNNIVSWYALRKFLDNDFKLTGLNVLPELNGKLFTELPEKYQLKLANAKSDVIYLANIDKKQVADLVKHFVTL